MNKEKFRDIVLKKIDEKRKDIIMNFARFKETEDPNYLRLCTEAKGFNDGVEWTIEQLQKVIDL